MKSIFVLNFIKIKILKKINFHAYHIIYFRAYLSLSFRVCLRDDGYDSKSDSDAYGYCFCTIGVFL
jgi:hypothetical protein